MSPAAAAAAAAAAATVTPFHTGRDGRVQDGSGGCQPDAAVTSITSVASLTVSLTPVTDQSLPSQTRTRHARHITIIALPHPPTPLTLTHRRTSFPRVRQFTTTTTSRPQEGFTPAATLLLCHQS